MMTRASPTHIVFAVDFSEMTDYVVRAAIQQAEAVTTPALHAVCVIGPSGDLLHHEERSYVAELAELKNVLRDRIETTFAERGHPLNAANGWPVTIHTRAGKPADEIAELAHEVGAELIVIGRHGHSGPRDFLIGTVPSRLLALARCSVLIVHPTDYA